MPLAARHEKGRHRPALAILTHGFRHICEAVAASLAPDGRTRMLF